jgi:hypothetical protein
VGWAWNVLPRESSSQVPPTPTREVAIRTLGVSLVLVAAVAASLTLSRHRADPRALLAGADPESSPAAVDLHLQAIRSAGL